ncbi:MAG: hypothetical protein JZU65_17445 [Chlorobium sp.]|nr:hypothetical protein [Chlorobium sp.]
MKVDNAEEVGEGDGAKKKRGRGRPPKKGGPSKRDIRCSMTDVQMEEIAKVRYPYEKSLASFVNRAVRGEINQRGKVDRHAKISAEQKRVMAFLDEHEIDEAKIRLIKIVLSTESRTEMHQKLLEETANRYRGHQRL